MDKNRINRKIFEYEWGKHSATGWSLNLRKIAECVDMSNLLDDFKQLPIAMVKNKLMEMYVNAIKAAVERKPKLCTYRQLKENAETEGYLLANLDKYKRSLICQFRLGILPLEVEVGRYANVEYENRVCKLCNDGVENEIHFILKCVALNDTRQRCLSAVPELTLIEEDVNKLKYLSNMPYRFSGMLQKLWQFRKNKLYDISV